MDINSYNGTHSHKDNLILTYGLCNRPRDGGYNEYTYLILQCDLCFIMIHLHRELHRYSDSYRRNGTKYNAIYIHIYVNY